MAGHREREAKDRLNRLGKHVRKGRRLRVQVYYILAMIAAFLIASMILIVKNPGGFVRRNTIIPPANQGIGAILEWWEQDLGLWNGEEVREWDHKLADEYSLDISQYGLDPEQLPQWQGDAFVELADRPIFPDELRADTGYESYATHDWLGRCGSAVANIGTDMMPTEQREDISGVHPSGWQTIQYDFIEGGNLYNRCHLIGFMLTGENANEYNLITGTRYMNIEGMLPFEKEVANYVRETNHHILYRVTPVYYRNELVARGVVMEAESVDDQDAGITFCVYVFNNQPDVEIDYRTGRSHKVADSSRSLLNMCYNNQRE